MPVPAGPSISLCCWPFFALCSTHGYWSTAKHGLALHHFAPCPPLARSPAACRKRTGTTLSVPAPVRIPSNYLPGGTLHHRGDQRKKFPLLHTQIASSRGRPSFPFHIFSFPLLRQGYCEFSLVRVSDIVKRFTVVLRALKSEFSNNSITPSAPFVLLWRPVCWCALGWPHGAPRKLYLPTPQRIATWPHAAKKTACRLDSSYEKHHDDAIPTLQSTDSMNSVDTPMPLLLPRSTCLNDWLRWMTWLCPTSAQLPVVLASNRNALDGNWLAAETCLSRRSERLHFCVDVDCTQWRIVREIVHVPKPSAVFVQSPTAPDIGIQRAQPRNKPIKRIKSRQFHLFSAPANASSFFAALSLPEPRRPHSRRPPL